MRLLRWKNRYTTGANPEDEANQALVALVNALADEANGVEHCQDLNELHAALTGLIEDHLKTAPEDLPDLNRQLQQILQERLPLPAKDTPACTDCGQCDLFNQRLGQWLDQHGEQTDAPREATG